MSGERKGAERRFLREGVHQDSAVTSERCAGWLLDAERDWFAERGHNSAKPGGFTFASDRAV